MKFFGDSLVVRPGQKIRNFWQREILHTIAWVTPRPRQCLIAQAARNLSAMISLATRPIPTVEVREKHVILVDLTTIFSVTKISTIACYSRAGLLVQASILAPILSTLTAGSRLCVPIPFTAMGGTSSIARNITPVRHPSDVAPQEPQIVALIIRTVDQILEEQELIRRRVTSPAEGQLA